MELTLPMNYVELEQEEMMYLDGGWNVSQLIRNAIGLTAVAGLSWVGSYIKNVAVANRGIGFWNMVGKIGVTAAKALWALPWWAKLAGLAAGAAVVFALGEYDIF